MSIQLLIGPVPQNVRISLRSAIVNNTGWSLYESLTLDHALEMLQNPPVGVVLCGDSAGTQGWMGIHEKLEGMPWAPNLIVCGENPDAMLWADVLSRGAYGVLPLPLKPEEVIRTCWLAWVSWREKLSSLPPRSPIAARAATYASEGRMAARSTAA